MPTCFECNLIVQSMAALHTHLKISHNLSQREGVNFRCGEGGGCFKSFSGWRSYRVHLIQAHKCPQLNCPVVIQPNVNKVVIDKKPIPDVQMQECYVSNGSDCDMNETDEEPLLDFATLAEDTVLEFSSSLFANKKMARSHVVGILKSTSEILKSMLDVIKPNVRKILKKECCKETIALVENQLDCLVAPFVKFSSEHMHLKALTERDHFISKHTFTVGSRVDDVQANGEMIRKITDVKAKFIPMRVVLQKLFSLPQVFSTVNSYVDKLSAEKNVLENFVQGELWRSKVQNYFQGKIVFPLFVYFDDFELGNPLGSHAGIHKLGAVYYSVACFPPEVASLLDNIFVVALFHSSDRVEFRNYSIFKSVIQELNFLQSEGILINTEAGPVRVYFALGLVLGDNLGLNQILGFQEGFNAYYQCRFCKTSKFQMQWETSEDHVRTPEMYDADVRAQDPKNSGIREKSVWDRVHFFKTCENYAVDFLHDGPEGALKKFMALIVFYFSFDCDSTKNTFLTVLNNRLRCFNYYVNVMKNKPPLIKYEEAHEKHLKMSASEMQNFILMFSMLVGDLVDHDNPVWSFYLSIRRVVDIVLGRRLQKDCAILLKAYTGEMYELYLKLFPNETATLKLHNFIHYYRIFLESGPIINLASYRFESKHKVKKTEGHATSSRVNLEETLAHKELLGLAYRFLLGKGFAPNNGCGKGKCINIKNVPGYFSFKSTCPASFLQQTLRMPKWVNVNGQFYRIGSCVITKTEGTDEVLPVFAVVDSILKNKKGDNILVCKTLTTLGFDSNYHAYKVVSTETYECVVVSELLTPFPCIVVSLNGNLFATPRHAL